MNPPELNPGSNPFLKLVITDTFLNVGTWKKHIFHIHTVEKNTNLGGLASTTGLELTTGGPFSKVLGSDLNWNLGTLSVVLACTGVAANLAVAAS